MPRRPLLFIDIDGVISVWGFPIAQMPNGRWTQVDGIAHFLSSEAARHLHALAELFECVWCSGWEDRANDHLPHLLGLGPFPHLVFEPGEREHWKLDAIDARAGDRPLAWIDDDHNAACEAWAAGRPAPTLLVATQPAIGLDAAATARLRAFARDLATVP